MEIEQLAPRHAFDGVKPERDPVLKKGLCVVVAKRQDHIPAYDVLGIPSIVMDTNAKDSGPHQAEYAWPIPPGHSPAGTSGNEVSPESPGAHAELVSRHSVLP